MTNWLTKLTTPPARRDGAGAVDSVSKNPQSAGPKKLPISAIIYGVASSVIAIAGIYAFVNRSHFSGGMTIIMALILLAIAVLEIRKAD